MYVSFKVIGSHIRDARKAKGLTQDPLSAEPTAKSVSFAERLSRMTSACTAQELEMLEEICGVLSRQKKTASA